MADWASAAVGRAIKRASKAGDKQIKSSPRAVSAGYDARNGRLVIELSNGVIMMLPPHLLEGLDGASAGSRTSARKSVSSRENGKRGGRPRIRTSS